MVHDNQVDDMANILFNRIIFIIAIGDEKVQPSISRPQSAKHGPKGQWPNQEQLTDQENTDRILLHKKKLKLVKPHFTTNDFSQLLPKKIYPDKERLYSETLQLKRALNQTSEENTRLKTKIAILEKEIEKMNKLIQSTDLTKYTSRLDIHTHKSQKENAMVRNLKKMVRESKDQNQYLRCQAQKIKKVIKYTKINQLEIERKMLFDENQRINMFLQQLTAKVSNQNDYERQVKQLKRYLEQQLSNNKQLQDANQNYSEYIDELEKKFIEAEEKNNEKDKRIQRQLEFTKKKLNEEVKLNDQLRKQLRTIKQSIENDKKNNNRPISSNPYTKKQSNTNNNQIQQLKKYNQSLSKQLKDVKLKLEQSQNNLDKLKVQNKQIISQLQKLKTFQQNFNKQSFNQLNNSESKVKKQQINIHTQSKIQSQLHKNQKDKKQNNSNQDQEYQQQFEKVKEENIYLQHLNEQKIQSIKIDFNEDQKQEKLYEREKSDKNKSNSNKKQKIIKDEKAFKPNKQILTQIKQLLTYRMKAQRYPFEQLKKDIQVSEEKQFNFMDLQNMLKSQPFFLTTKYTSTILQYIFQEENPSKQLTTTSQNLIKKLRKVIDNFELAQQKTEEKMLQQLAHMTSQYPQQLESLFEKGKNTPGTISKKNLVEMFQKLQLENNYIQLIISQLSLCSEDIEHLSYYGFFKRFNIRQQQKNQVSNKAIDEEQAQSSAGSSKYIKKQPKSKQKSKKLKNKKQYQDDDQIVMSKDEKLDLSKKKNNGPEKKYDEVEIISDDEKI